jgi:hypothetical protein
MRDLVPVAVSRSLLYLSRCRFSRPFDRTRVRRHRFGVLGIPSWVSTSGTSIRHRCKIVLSVLGRCGRGCASPSLLGAGAALALVASSRYPPRSSGSQD